MKGHQVTIKDIAKILHISPSTVSRALKDHPDINPQTKKSVQDLAKKLNYKPNQVALNLLQKESKIIISSLQLLVVLKKLQMKLVIIL